VPESNVLNAASGCRYVEIAVYREQTRLLRANKLDKMGEGGKLEKELSTRVALARGKFANIGGKYATNLFETTIISYFVRVKYIDKHSCDSYEFCWVRDEL
jgi:hypothetical protein